VLVRRHPFLVHAVTGTAAALLLDAALSGFEDTGLWQIEKPGIEVISVAVGFAIPISATIMAMRGQLGLLVGIVRHTRPAAVPVMLRIVGEELKELEAHVNELQIDGRLFKSNEIPKWVHLRCFSVARGPYLASDALTPSEFMERYERLLGEHAQYLKRLRRRNARRSVRVNIALEADLALDRSEQPEMYRRYYEWHASNGVQLLHLPRTDAQTLAARCGLGEKLIDVGMCVGEVALSLVDEDGETRVRLGLAGGPLYRAVESYLAALQAAEPIEFPAP
jgi:hypothetical protein